MGGDPRRDGRWSVAQRYAQSFQGHKFTQMFQSILCCSAQYKFNLTHKLLAHPCPAKGTNHSASFRFCHAIFMRLHKQQSKGRDGTGRL